MKKEQGCKSELANMSKLPQLDPEREEGRPISMNIIVFPVKDSRGSQLTDNPLTTTTHTHTRMKPPTLGPREASGG